MKSAKKQSATRKAGQRYSTRYILTISIMGIVLGLVGFLIAKGVEATAHSSTSTAREVTPAQPTSKIKTNQEMPTLNGDDAVEFLKKDASFESLNEAGKSIREDGPHAPESTTKLTASDGHQYLGFGFSVAISGNTAIVGAHDSAYIFVRSGTTWTLQQKLTAPEINSGFGQKVAISGDTAIVTVAGDGIGGTPLQGAAYVFVRNGTTWTQQQKLKASDGARDDDFGYSVAISGDTAIVGAPHDDIGGPSPQTNEGSAYIFVRSGGTWTQQQKLRSSDMKAHDNFGGSVAISDDTAIIGSGVSGAYIFERNGTTWAEQQKLSVNAGDGFGFGSVAISGDTVIAGALVASGSTWSGSAYVFVRSGTTWTLQQRLTATGGAAGDRFGGSVAIDDDTAIVGADPYLGGGSGGIGSVYVFGRCGTTWMQQAKKTASDGAANDRYGSSIAISGDTAIIGAPGHDIGSNISQGAAYVLTPPDLPQPECDPIDLTIEIPDKRLEVDDQFPATVKVKSNLQEPLTIAFADPLLSERPYSDVEADAILTMESYPLPPPFVLTPEGPTRSFTVVVRVNKLGATELVSTLSYTRQAGTQGTLTATKRISAPPFKVDIDITPKQTVLNNTAVASKSVRCRVIEEDSANNKNCIEITATVKNKSDKTITNVNIPNATNPLKLINETNPKIPGEPVSPIEFIHPAGPGPTYPPVDLAAGQEATWTWRINAYDAPAQLEFEPTVFGVMNGQEVGGHGYKEFKILKNVLLKWGMRARDHVTSFKAGDPVHANGYLENVSAANNGEGKLLLAHIYATHKGNVGGGWVVPADYAGPEPMFEHLIYVPHKEGENRVNVKSLFRSLRTGRASSAEVEFGIRAWVVNNDGSLTDVGDQALLDAKGVAPDGGYSDGFALTYSAVQIPTDPYLQECLNANVPVEFCGFSDKFYSDFLPGLVGLAEFAWDGLDSLGEATHRSMAMQAKRDQLALRSVMDDPEAKNALLQSLHEDYVVLHQQGVIAGQVAGSLPMALGEFSNQTLDSFGRYLFDIENGDLQAVRLKTGQFFGSNPDFALEPLIMLRGILKLRGAMKSLRTGTADNLFAAAVETYGKKQAADLDTRIAAKKAEAGDPDLAKALLPGDRLSAKLLMDVFGVDEDTVRRLQKIADDSGVVLAFRARSNRASELLKQGLAWAKPQALKQKCVNKLDIDYLGYDPDAFGVIQIVEPPTGLRDFDKMTDQQISDALDAHMEKLINSNPPKPELQGPKGEELRAEVRDRIKTRAEEWSKYTPKLKLDTPGGVPNNVNFEAPMQWARDRVTDLGPDEVRKIYNQPLSSRVDPATGEPVRRWEITMDGPGGQPAKQVTGDIDFLGILDQNGNFVNDVKKRMAIYKAMYEGQLMEHGESMSFRMEKARVEYLECCLLGKGEGMLTIGPWGPPRVGFFIDNRSVINEANAAFKRVRRVEIARKPSGEIIYENGQPKQIVIRHENPNGEFLLYNGSPMLNFIDEGVERVFQVILWKTVARDVFERYIKLFFPRLLKDFIEDQTQNSLSPRSATDPIYKRGGPVVRFEPYALVELVAPNNLQMWTIGTGWKSATPQEVVAAGEPGVVDFAPYSVLRENSAAGDNKLIVSSLAEMGATGDFFQSGDAIVLDPGGARQETAVILSLNPLTLTAPLQFDHNVGEMIAWIEAPTGSSVKVSGRVLSDAGRGLGNAVVSITGPENFSRTVTTNALGFYSFSDLPGGRKYTFNVRSKRFRFTQREIMVSSDLSDVDFTGLE